MNEIVLPALRGDRIVGYLAALGVLQLISERSSNGDAELCWPNGARHGAMIRTDAARNIEELASVLFETAVEMKSTGRLVPGVDGLPLRGDNSDPMNSLSFDDARGLSTTYQDDVAGSEWLVSMVNRDAPSDAGALGRSRWWAVGPGPVTIRGTLTKALEVVDSPDALVTALSAWRRHDWVGGYLDITADIGKERTAGHRQKDHAKSAVVGATWLALLATRWFPERAVLPHRSETVGWRVVDRHKTFRYAIWTQPLSAEAVRVLLDHPAVWLPFKASVFESLGVAEVWQSTRLRAGNNDASMTHPVRVWPASQT